MANPWGQLLENILARMTTTPDGDAIIDDAGDAVRVNIVAGAGSGGTASTDDSAFTVGSGSGTPAMGIYEVTPDSVDDGDVGVVGMTADRQLKVSIETDNVGIGGGTQYTEDAVAAADPVGNAQILVREDAPISIAVDGDNVARRGTQYGAAYSQIVDSSGNFVDSFGGGTQYLEGATDASITGTALMFEGAADTLVAAPGTAANGLDVDVTRVSGTVTVDGSGVTQPVSGTVTETNSAAILADTASMDTNLGTVAGAVAAGQMQVDIVADGAGLATAANQLPDGHAVTVDNAAGAAAVNIQDGGNSITIDGTVTADAGTGSFNNDSVAAEGGAVVNGVLIQGDDGTDRKNINVDATTGDVQVDVTNTVTVDGSGVTQPVSGTVTANLSATDNTVLDNIDTNTTDIPNVIGTDGLAGPTKALSVGGTQATGELQELLVDADGHLQVDVLTDPGGGTTDTDDDVVAGGQTAGLQIGLNYGWDGTQWERLATDASGSLDVNLTSDAAGLATAANQLPDGHNVTIDNAAGASAVNIQDGGNSITVDGTVTETNSAAILADTASMDTNLGTVAGAVAAGQMQVDIVADGAGLATAANQLPDGHNVTIDNSTGAAAVNIQDGGNSITVDNGGTFATQATIQNASLDVIGTVADDGTTPGDPVMVGGYAIETDGTDPGEVSAEGDAARFRTDLNRRLLVNTAHPNLWSASENNATAQTNNELKAAPGANLSLYITDIVVSNGATAGEIKFVEDTAGTPIDKIETLYLAANGGATINFTTPIRITANTNFGYTSTTVTTHTVHANGYIAP